MVTGIAFSTAGPEPRLAVQGSPGMIRNSLREKGRTMLGGFGALVSSVGGVFLVFRGIDVFDCRSVSFSSDFTTCYPNDFGAMTGAIAGFGLVAAGTGLFIFALVRLASIK